MKRRDFIKTGLFAVSALYGLTESVIRGKESGGATAHAGADEYRFAGTYESTVTDDQISLPGEYSRQLRKDGLILFASKGDKTLFLLPEGSPDWRALKMMVSAVDKKEAKNFRWRRARYGKTGSLNLTKSMRKFAGMQKGAVTISGHGGMIKITDAEVSSR